VPHRHAQQKQSKRGWHKEDLSSCISGLGERWEASAKCECCDRDPCLTIVRVAREPRCDQHRCDPESGRHADGLLRHHLRAENAVDPLAGQLRHLRQERSQERADRLSSVIDADPESGEGVLQLVFLVFTEEQKRSYERREDETSDSDYRVN
jgi:hypothetical protein